MANAHVALDLLTVRPAPPLPAPAWLCLYWPYVGDLRLWTLGDDGQRQDHPGIDASHRIVSVPPGQDHSRSFVLTADRPGELWIAWTGTGAPTGIHLVEVLSGGHQLWPAVAYQASLYWRRADGRLYWRQVTAAAGGGVDIAILRRDLADDEAETVATVHAASLEIDANGWHRDHAVIQTASGQVTVIDLDGQTPDRVIPTSGIRAIGGYAPPALAADPHAEGTIGMTLGGASDRPGLTEGRVRAHLEGGKPIGGYYVHGEQITGGDVDDAIDLTLDPHCRWNADGTDAFLYPFDSTGRGRWIDHTQGPGARNNLLDEAHVQTFAPYDEPGTEPHVVWPLDAWPDWSV